MSEWASRLSRRIEELVASSDDNVDEPMRDGLAGLERALVATRGEVSALRADLADLRDTVTVFVGRSNDDAESATAALRSQVESLVADVRRTGQENSAAAGARDEAVRRAVNESRDVVEERIAALEDGVATLSDRLEALARDGVSEASDRLAKLVEHVRTLPESLASRFPDLTVLEAATVRELADLRGDLADALEEIRDRITAQVAELGAGQTTDLLDRLDEGNAVVARRVAELTGPISAVAASSTDTEERLAHLEELAAGIQRELSAVSSEWSSRTTAVVEQAREAGETAAHAVEESAHHAAAEFEERVAELLGESRGEIATVLGESRQAIAADLGEAREGLTRDLTEARDRVAGQLTEVRENTTALV